jgi:hypothetical protein
MLVDAVDPTDAYPKEAKVFWFFFSKKNCFPSGFLRDVTGALGERIEFYGVFTRNARYAPIERRIRNSIHRAAVLT